MNKAYQAYVDRANKVSLSQDYKNRIMNGELRIEDITDESLHDQISEFQEWYEKALDCKYEIVELEEALGDIIDSNFENITSQFEALTDQIEHQVDMLEGELDMIENKGNFAGAQYYKNLMQKEEEMARRLQEEYSSLIAARDDAVSSGVVAKGSEAYNDMASEINDVEQAWQDAKNAIIEYKNEMWEMDWSIFEKFIEYVDMIPTESEFIRDLLSVNENDLFSKKSGEFTESGWTTGALHALDYNVYMKEADEYAKKIQEINALIAQDPTNTILLDKRLEYLEAQQSCIDKANEEKQAIQDLYSESYDRLIDSLERLVEARKDELDAEKDLYSYRRDVEDQVKTIADLEKQLASLRNDDSESANSNRQQLENELDEAKADLEEMQWDQYIEDFNKLSDNFLNDFQEYLNERLDQIDALLQSMIDYANNNTATVNDTINTATSNVGYTLTEGMSSIWNNTSSGIGKILTDYQGSFTTTLTTTNNYIQSIYNLLQQATNKNTTASKPTTSKPSTGSTVTNNTKKPSSNTSTSAKPAKKTPTVGGKINAGSAPIYSYAGDRNGLHQYFASDPIYTVLKKQAGYLLVRWHRLSQGYTGWFKESDVTAMKTGGYTGNAEGMAMLHKKERVLSAQQTKAYDDFVYNIMPSIQKQFKASGTVGNSVSNVNADMNVTFNLPNVKDTDTFIRELQGSKKFERLITGMTFDKVTGRGKLSKNRIRA